MSVSFKNLKGKTVNQLFLIVWHPIGEDKITDVDISIGLVLSETEDSLIVISTDKNDNCTPSITVEAIPSEIFIDP
jgi:hypothetical protein